ncbi:glycosyl transferase [Bacteroidia bacterium]|nr:glycosyl transferase [Bacteroidia bacterium]
MKKYTVQNIGGRRNYDVAAILSRANMLEYLVTDLYWYDGNRKILERLFFNNRILKRLSSKSNKIIPNNCVVSSQFIEYSSLLLRQLYSQNPYKAYIYIHKLISKKTVDVLKKTNSNAIYGLDTESVEIFEFAKHNGFFTAMEQCVAPRSSQIRMYQFFEEKYGISCKKKIISCEKLQEREMKEWELSDTILVPSSYVHAQMLLAGVAENKMKLVPYGFNIPENILSLETMINKRIGNNSVFKILFVGNSSLRKGIQDIAKIAEILKYENIEFRIAGIMDNQIIKRFNIDKLNNIIFLGSLNKEMLYKEYENADMLILPSYLEGSAMVILEALSFGLPVVTTKESGSFIASGIDGYVCDAGDIDNMVSFITQLIYNDDLRYKISYATKSMLDKVSFENYSENLINALK